MILLESVSLCTRNLDCSFEQDLLYGNTLGILFRSVNINFGILQLSLINTSLSNFWLSSPLFWHSLHDPNDVERPNGNPLCGLYGSKNLSPAIKSGQVFRACGTHKFGLVKGSEVADEFYKGIYGAEEQKAECVRWSVSLFEHSLLGCSSFVDVCTKTFLV